MLDNYDRVGIEYNAAFRRLGEMVDRRYKCKGFHRLNLFITSASLCKSPSVRLQLPLFVIVTRGLEFLENNITEVFEVVQTLLEGFIDSRALYEKSTKDLTAYDLVNEAYHMSGSSGSFYPLQDVVWNSHRVRLLGYFIGLEITSRDCSRDSHFFMIIYLKEFPNV